MHFVKSLSSGSGGNSCLCDTLVSVPFFLMETDYLLFEFKCVTSWHKLTARISTGNLILPLQRGTVTAHTKGRCRKHCYWSTYKVVLLESSFFDSSACFFIYLRTASFMILPIIYSYVCHKWNWKKPSEITDLYRIHILVCQHRN